MSFNHFKVAFQSHVFGTQGTLGNTAYQTVGTRWTAMTKKQTPSTNYRAVSGTVAVPVILTVLSHVRGSKTAVLMMCTAVLRKYYRF